MRKSDSKILVAALISAGLMAQPLAPFFGSIANAQTRGTPGKPTTTPTTTPTTSGNNNPTSTKERGGDVDRSEPGTKINPAVTRAIIERLGSTQNECGKYDPRYRIDCLRQGIQLALSRLPKSGEYAEARRILKKAERDLKAIVDANVDTSAPIIEPGIKKKNGKTVRYRAIRADRMAGAMKQATAVIEEARTQLLRSSENSRQRSAAYQEIAAAVGSTKVLLRSG